MLLHHDEGAFEELYDRHSADAFALAVRVTCDSSLAEDVVLESFIDLSRSASSFDSMRVSVRTFLLLITHRRAVTAVRARHAVEALGDAVPPPAPDKSPDVWPKPSTRLSRHTLAHVSATETAQPPRGLSVAAGGAMTTPPKTAR